MDPDSWPIIQLVISLLLMIPAFLTAGVVSEEATQKEISDSGVGVSMRETASYLICAIQSAFAADGIRKVSALAAGAILEPFTDPAASFYPVAPYFAICVVCGVLLAVLAAACFAALPLFWGRGHSEAYTEKLKFPLWLVRVFVPVARLVTAPARSVLRARGVGSELGSVTEEDVLDDVEELHEIDDNQKEMIGNIFELADVKAADIMTHRTELEAVSADASVGDVVDKAVEFGYSRLPVYEGTLDKIIGVAYVKDLLAYVGKNTGEVQLKSLLRKTLFVPESCRVRELMLDFKQKKVQFAVVVDEYGGTAGIVTMEDILESIVGDIEDEYDEEEALILKNKDGSLTCDGTAEIEDVYEALGFEEAPDEIESDTIGGLLTELLGRIPGPGERPEASYGGEILLTALSADERRITSVLVKRVQEAEAAPKD